MTTFYPGLLGVTDTDIGTTTDAYVDALDWACLGYGKKTIVLKNTDAANSLDYKVLVRAYDTGQDAEEIAETTLAAGDLVRIALANAYAGIKLQVKATIVGNQATYQLDHIGLPVGVG